MSGYATRRPGSLRFVFFFSGRCRRTTPTAGCSESEAECFCDKRCDKAHRQLLRNRNITKTGTGRCDRSQFEACEHCERVCAVPEGHRRPAGLGSEGTGTAIGPVKLCSRSYPRRQKLSRGSDTETVPVEVAFADSSRGHVAVCGRSLRNRLSERSVLKRPAASQRLGRSPKRSVRLSFVSARTQKTICSISAKH